MKNVFDDLCKSKLNIVLIFSLRKIFFGHRKIVKTYGQDFLSLFTLGWGFVQVNTQPVAGGG